MKIMTMTANLEANQNTIVFSLSPNGDDAWSRRLSEVNEIKLSSQER
jgi:hypothetical protein